MGYFTLGFLFLMALGGACVLALGIRGVRIATVKLCRVCGFDLAGLGERLPCPECGAELSEPKAVKLVTRAKRPLLVRAGVAMVLVALAGPAFLLADAASSGRMSVYSPTWVLAMEVRIMGRHSPEIARKELLSRCAAGKGSISDSTLRAVALSVMSGLSEREATPDELTLVVGMAGAAGLVSKDEMARHLATPMPHWISTPERVRQGEALVSGDYINVGNNLHVPPDGVWAVGRRITALEIDGQLLRSRPATTFEEAERWQPLITRLPGMVIGSVPASWGVAEAVPLIPILLPGVYELRVHLSVDVYFGRADLKPGSHQEVQVCRVEVLPAGAPLVTLVSDEKFRQEMKERFTLHASRSSGPGSPDMVWVNLKEGANTPRPSANHVSTSTRIGGAWRILIEINGELRSCGRLKVGWKPDGRPFAYEGHAEFRLPADVRKLRVVLSPFESFAAERDAIDVMPAGDIEFVDVFVRG